MAELNFITNPYFWKVVYITAKWILITLNFILTGIIIWLLFKISNFRQKLNVKGATKEFIKPAAKTETVANPKESLNFVAETVKTKWEEIISKIETGGENDFKLAVIEADTLLDLVFKRKGVPGETFKERMNYIRDKNMVNLDSVWEAHKARNELAHNNNFVLTKKQTAEILMSYKEALRKLELI